MVQNLRVSHLFCVQNQIDFVSRSDRLSLPFLTCNYPIYFSQNLLSVQYVTHKIAPEDSGKARYQMAVEAQKTAQKAVRQTSDDMTDSSATSGDIMTKKERIGNINGNDKENVPYTLFLVWAVYIVANLNQDAYPCLDVLFISCLVWLLARVSHTFCYLFGLQPFRSLSYLFGQLAALSMAITLVIASFMVRFSDDGCTFCKEWVK